MRFWTVLRYTGLLVFAYLLLLSISYGESPYQPIITILIGLLIWLSAKNINILNSKYGITRVLIGILLMGGVIRFLWAAFVPTLPVSDFQIYHRDAMELSQGIPVLSKNMGYSLLLSAGYRIYSSVLTGKLINATASTLSILFLYLIGSKLCNQQTGLMAAFLFALLPSEVLMVSVLGTEVLATTIGLISAYFIFRSRNNKSTISIVSIFYAGLFYGLILTVRNSSGFYFPAIVLWIIIASLNYREIGKVLGAMSLGIFAGLLIVLAGYFLTTKQFTLVPIKMQTSLPFLIGTNVDSAGGWSQDDLNLYLSWPIDERDALARQEAMKRIIFNPKDFLLLIPKKIGTLMGPNDYGIYWSLRAIDWGGGNDFGIQGTDENNWAKYGNFKDNFIEINSLFLQSFYIIIWFFALYAFKNSKDSSLSFIVFILVLSTLLPHTILEVQSRYHHFAVPFILLLASDGIIQKSHAVVARGTLDLSTAP